jgi:hypothetical protein
MRCLAGQFRCLRSHFLLNEEGGSFLHVARTGKRHDTNRGVGVCNGTMRWPLVGARETVLTGGM